ncbi:hypothetical protein [Celeribacter sp.]|uniref:hypothetical protein n=1 Tax=Celeribacter sp. TaxID=1890673 RepID=UPI003A92A8A8
MSSKPRKIAVLTGDLVNSTGLGPENVERAFDALEACAEMQADWMDGQSLHFTRHRGDGWQVALADPKYALRSALCFRAALRRLGEEFDSYIGIAEGEVEGEIGPDLNEANGEAFMISGNLLAITKLPDRTVHMLFDAACDVGTPPAATLACLQLLEAIFNKWTKVQAQTMLPMLSLEAPQSYTELAEQLGKSRQSVSKTLSAADYYYVSQALINIEDAHA